MENELSELLSNSEEDLPSWDEERYMRNYSLWQVMSLFFIYRLSTLDQFIQLKTKAGMKAKFIQERYYNSIMRTHYYQCSFRSAVLSKYKQHFTSTEVRMESF